MVSRRLLNRLPVREIWLTIQVSYSALHRHSFWSKLKIEGVYCPPFQEENMESVSLRVWVSVY